MDLFNNYFEVTCQVVDFSDDYDDLWNSSKVNNYFSLQSDQNDGDLQTKEPFSLSPLCDITANQSNTESNSIFPTEITENERIDSSQQENAHLTNTTEMLNENLTNTTEMLNENESDQHENSEGDASLKVKKPEKKSKTPEVDLLKKNSKFYNVDYRNCYFYKGISMISIKLIEKIGQQYNKDFQAAIKAGLFPKFKRIHKRNKGVGIWFFEEVLCNHYPQIQPWLSKNYDFHV